MRQTGRITTWQDAKGFGFITPAAESEAVFVHISAFASRQRRPTGGETVSYELARDPQGRAQAHKVRFSGTEGGQPRSGSGNAPALFIGGGFALALLAATLAGTVPILLAAVYPILSVITLIAYALDKSAARAGRWRTPENTLHLLALAGGWPGALLAQHWLHHKSSKVSFLIVFWITVIFNCAALLWLCTTGRRWLAQL